jgi:hypothetical protein
MVVNDRAARLRRDPVPLFALAAALAGAVASWYRLKEPSPLLRPLILAVFLADTILPGSPCLAPEGRCVFRTRSSTVYSLGRRISARLLSSGRGSRRTIAAAPVGPIPGAFHPTSVRHSHRGGRRDRPGQSRRHCALRADRLKSPGGDFTAPCVLYVCCPRLVNGDTESSTASAQPPDRWSARCETARLSPSGALFGDDRLVQRHLVSD